MTVLVLGASGQVASHLRSLLHDAVYWGRQTFDLAGPSPLTAAIHQLGPSMIVHAAAHTAVDKAESEADLACGSTQPRTAVRNVARGGRPSDHVVSLRRVPRAPGE